MNNTQAVVFGAGKMACGLLGQLLAQSGYATTFIARRPAVIDAINRQRGYALHITGDSTRRLTIRNSSALSINDRPAVVDSVANADVVFTAVGIDNLASVTPAIAEGLGKRFEMRGANPLNVVACENLPGAGAYLKHQVANATSLENELALEDIGGFSAALTRRIMTGGEVERGELTFTVDADYDLVIDANGLKGTFPDVQGATLTDEFPAMVMRKLFLLNCAHAMTAYLGYREGCHYVHEAAVHPAIANVLHRAVAEAQAALKAEFPQQAAGIDREAAEALQRIANPRLADPISRVARAPRRKLSPRERLVGPARLASKHALPYEHLALGIAAALAYDDPNDAQAVTMQQAIAAGGVEVVLTEDCGLLPHEDLSRVAKQQWLRLSGGKSQPRKRAATLFGQSNAALEDIALTVTVELSQRYEPRHVQDVVARVAQEFRSARIMNYVPVLMKRMAIEQLQAGTP